MQKAKWWHSGVIDFGLAPIAFILSFCVCCGWGELIAFVHGTMLAAVHLVNKLKKGIICAKRE